MAHVEELFVCLITGRELISVDVYISYVEDCL